MSATVVCVTVMDVDLNERLPRALVGTRTVVTIEKHSRVGGIGSAVAEVLAGAASGQRLLLVGADEDVLDVYGSQEFLSLSDWGSGPIRSSPR